MTTKAIIIGASTVGKTKLLNYLKKNTHLQLIESDDLLIAMNGGTFPQDYDYKLNVLAPKMVADVLQQDKIIFFTNVDYFTHQNLLAARQQGFKIIQLILPREHMETRNKYRIEHEGYDDLSSHFDRMEAYQKDISDKKLVDIVISTNKPIETIAEELTVYLSS
jgi:guanylate kinase